MVVLLLVFFDAAVSKLLSLTQGPVKIVLKLTALSGGNNIEKEWGGKDDMIIVPLILLLFDSSVQERVLIFYSSRY